MKKEYVTSSPEETIALGKKIGKLLQGGEVFAVIGELGAGKTQLIKGIVAGAGDPRADRLVTSPTFVIINEYAGKFQIYHIDAYRISSIAEFENVGFHDLCRPDSVVLIEWADKVEDAIKLIDYIKIYISHISKLERNISIHHLPVWMNTL